MNNISLPNPVLKIFEHFRSCGYEIWAIGGSVRDILIGKKTKNWDFTTNATPEEIQKLFPDSFYDNRFGTVGISLKHLKEQFPSITVDDEREIYEITTYRTEKKYQDFRHPEIVSWGKSLNEDLKRRDFTINAIALTMLSENKKSEAIKNTLKIVDLYKGIEDLKNKIIRAVGDPNERFYEDALRMMRAVRFAAEHGFIIEEKTLKAIINNGKLLTNISWERIRDELLKILSSPYPYEGMVFLRQTGLLEIILPELAVCFSVEQKSPGRHHIYDVGNHSLLSLKQCPSQDPIVRMATMLHDIGKAKTVAKLDNGTITFYNHEVIGSRLIKNISSRLRLSNEQKNKLWLLVRWHQFTVDEHQTDAAIRRFIRRVGVSNIKDMVDLRIGDRLGGGLQTATSWRLQLYLKRIIDVQKHTPSVKDLKINGFDIMKILGIKPGPLVGQILNKLFKEITVDPAKNTKEYLLSRIEALGKN